MIKTVCPYLPGWYGRAAQKLPPVRSSYETNPQHSRTEKASASLVSTRSFHTHNVNKFLYLSDALCLDLPHFE
jgi:hypothetical protein